MKKVSATSHIHVFELIRTYIKNKNLAFISSTIVTMTCSSDDQFLLFFYFENDFCYKLTNQVFNLSSLALKHFSKVPIFHILFILEFHMYHFNTF